MPKKNEKSKKKDMLSIIKGSHLYNMVMTQYGIDVAEKSSEELAGKLKETKDEKKEEKHKE